MGCGPGGTEEAKANVRLIVRACNSHDALLEMCRVALVLCEAEIVRDDTHVADRLRAAIAKAEEGE